MITAKEECQVIGDFVHFAEERWKINPSKVPVSWMTIMAAAGAWIGAFGFMNIFTVTDITRMIRRIGKKGSFPAGHN